MGVAHLALKAPSASVTMDFFCKEAFAKSPQRIPPVRGSFVQATAPVLLHLIIPPSVFVALAIAQKVPNA